MYRFSTIKSVLWVIALGGLTGCGGVVGGSNPYAGTYTGTFVNQNNDVGTEKITASNSGSISGTLTDTTNNSTVSISGSFNSSFAFTGTLTISGVKTSVTGQLYSTNSTNGYELDVANNGSTIFYNMTLTKQ